MWTRSQNRSTLTNGIVTYYIACNNIGVGNESNSRNDGKVLASYSTKEKAMKVMDMLESHIENNENAKCGIDIVHIYEVFQFPQDNEVKL